MRILIDIRWVLLVATCVAVFVLVRARREWAEIIIAVAAVAAVLITLFFHVSIHVA